MTTLPEPHATRLRRPSWRDSRLLVGLLLVLGSVAVGARVVAAADDTVPVYAAAVTLPPGRAVAAADLRVVRVRLGSGAAAYLPASASPPAGSVLLRTVGAGELIPSSAVGPPGALDRRPVAVPVAAPVPDALAPGAQVDVWSSAKDPAAASTRYQPPVRLALAAPVYAVSGDGSGLGVARGASVQVLLLDSELRAVLDALANGARLAVVPAPGSAPSS